MSKSYSKSKGRSYSHSSFAGIPRIVMDSPDYKSLNGGAVKLLLELARQYRGKNNGDLTVAYSLLRNRGFNSKDPIKKAVKTLLDAGLIIRTREGVFTNPGGRCSLYALTWQSIDDCPGKDLIVGPTSTAPRKFSTEINKTPRPQNGPDSSLKEVRQRERGSDGKFSSSLKQVRLMAVT